MKPFRVVFLASLISCAWMTNAQAEHTVLPTLKLLAEPELRNETGVLPFQEDEAARRALQHIVLRGQQDAQNFVVDSQVLASLDYQPATRVDMSGLTPMLQAYVMGIANGLQSADPTNGLYQMLQPVGIHRGNIDDVRKGVLKLKLTTV